MTGTRLLRLLSATVLVAVLVWAVGSRMVAPADRHAVAVGVMLAAAWQGVIFAVTVTSLPHNRLVAFGVGMLARFLLVAVAALVALPALQVPLGPALLSMVTVLFATTLIEPVLFAAGAGDTTGR